MYTRKKGNNKKTKHNKYFSYGLLHRDVTPANLFFDASFKIKIGDFGLATRAHRDEAKEDTSDGANTSISLTKDVGTLFYIPPEARRTGAESKNYDSKFDLYSCGVVLFEMFMKVGLCA